MRGPLLPPVPGQRGLARRPDHFDDIALGVIESVDRPWRHRLGRLEYAVEDVPDLGPRWRGTSVPLSTVIPRAPGTPARLVIFRRPVEHRARTRAEQEELLLTVVVEQLAELLGMAPEEVDPRYDAG